MDVKYTIFGPTIRRIGGFDDCGHVVFNRDHDITGPLSYLMMTLVWYINLHKMGVPDHDPDMQAAYRDRRIAEIKQRR